MSKIKIGKHKITEAGEKIDVTVINVKPQGRGHTVTYRTGDGRETSVSAGQFQKLLGA